MKFKRVIAGVVAISLAICLSGCDFNDVEIERENSDGRMTIIYSDRYCSIYVDNETGCQYFSQVNCGTCLMVDENGDPLIYEKGE